MLSLRTILAISFVLIATATAQAKEPFEPIGELTDGFQVIHTKLKNGQSSKELAEFLYLGGRDIMLVTPNHTADIRMPGLGWMLLEWTGSNGHRYVIEDYPGNNNGKPVYGKVFGNKGPIGAFSIRPVTTKSADPVGGHWRGVLAFQTSAWQDITIQVSHIAQDAFEECSHGALPARIELPGYPFQEAAVIHCDDEFINGNDYSVAFLVMDPTTSSTWFLLLDGFLTEDGQFFQGDLSAMPLFGGDMRYGKFSLERPGAFIE